MIKKEISNVARKRRHARVRSKISGTKETPRQIGRASCRERV